ncbi:hypothetical protein M8J76_016844 [Diaphorina citri]|nr:hypothetical protein M8J76_016844 [Diaphorina citri]
MRAPPGMESVAHKDEEGETSGGDEVGPGGGDSISPCTTPLDATELEYDNYDGQFVFVGNRFEQSVQMLQQQMSVLADNQTHTDERYSRVKQENAGLQARILMLEEQLRDVEIRAEERLAEEEKRHRELIGRVDREKVLQVENCAIRLQNIEAENGKLKEEVSRARASLEKCKEDNERLTDSVEVSEAVIQGLQQELSQCRTEERKSRDVIQNQRQVRIYIEIFCVSV